MPVFHLFLLISSMLMMPMAMPVKIMNPPMIPVIYFIFSMYLIRDSAAFVQVYFLPVSEVMWVMISSWAWRRPRL